MSVQQGTSKLPKPVRGVLRCMTRSDVILKNVLDGLADTSCKLNTLLEKPNVWYSGVKEKVLESALLALESVHQDILDERCNVQAKLSALKKENEDVISDEESLKHREATSKQDEFGSCRCNIERSVTTRRSSDVASLSDSNEEMSSIITTEWKKLKMSESPSEALQSFIFIRPK